MDVREILEDAIADSDGIVRIPITVAGEIAALLWQRDEVESIADVALTPQQRSLFFLMRNHPGLAFPPDDLMLVAGIPNPSALHVAIWRLGKALERHLPQFRVVSAIGEGWMIQEVKRG